MISIIKTIYNKLTQKTLAKLPEGVIVYCIGDIHGRADLLLDVQNKIRKHQETQIFDKAYEIYLGDYIDRGNSSKETLDILSKYQPANRECIFISGNHEAMLLNFLNEDFEVYNIWKLYGGSETLNSYGVKLESGYNIDIIKKVRKNFLKNFPQSHYNFFQNLNSHFILGDYFFVHAGVNPKRPLEEQDDKTMMTIRDEFLTNSYWLGKRVVHGHTPVNEPYVSFNRINIDTGAYISNNLSCLFLKDDIHDFL